MRSISVGWKDMPGLLTRNIIIPKMSLGSNGAASLRLVKST